MTITASRTPTFVGNPPSYIRVLPDTVANLPPITFDHIPLPDGSVTHALTPSSRISPVDASNLALVSVTSGDSAIAHGGSDVGGTHNNVKAERWMLRGLRFKPVPAAPSPTGLNPGSQYTFLYWQGTDTGGWWGAREPLAAEPSRLLANQCYFDAADLYGFGARSLAKWSGTYLGLINSWSEGMGAGIGGANCAVWLDGSACGPYLIENNRLPAFSWFFTGGGSSLSWNRNPSATWRRNDLCVPRTWRYAEGWGDDARPYGPDGGNGYRFTVSNGGLTLTRVGGTGGWNWIGQPYKMPVVGAYLYQPETGIARQFAGLSVPADDQAIVTLTTPWPVADGTVLDGLYLQHAPPAVLFQSGLTGQLAHTTAGSRTVTLDTALPLYTSDGTTPIEANTTPLPERGPFFYLNNTAARGDCAHNHTATPTPGRTLRSNDYGPGHGGYFTPAANITKPYARPLYDPNPAFGGQPYLALTPTQQAQWNPDSCRRRVEVVGISADRKTLTLASPYFETKVFTFSLVQSDGLPRDVANGAQSKGAFELKCGERMLWEGNVVDAGLPATFNGVSNDNWHAYNTTLVGDQLTLLPGGYLDQWYVAMYDRVAARRTFGYYPGTTPDTYRPTLPALMAGYHNPTGYGIHGRYVKSLDSPTTATLEPHDPAYGDWDDIGATPAEIVFWSTTAWRIRHIITRFNLELPAVGADRMFGSIVLSAAEGLLEQGGDISIHDNLVLPWDPSTTLQPFGYLLNNPQQAGLAPRPGLIPKWMDNSNPRVRMSHNTVARAIGTQRRGAWMVTSDANPTYPTDAELADNIFDQQPALFAYQYGPLGDPSFLPMYYNQPAARIARNICIAATAPTDLPAQLGSVAPDNVGFASAAPVGFATTWTGPVSVDPAHYALTDIYATGTVSIASDGLGAILTSGTWPASVVQGQFFRTATLPGVLKRISNPPVTNTIRWDAPAHPEAGQAGLGFAITFKGTGTDGADPGANMALVKAFTDGVRRDF